MKTKIMKRNQLFTARTLGLLALGLLAACGETDCGGCLAPLDEPFPEDKKFNGAAQVRLTPAGVGFLEQQLPTIIQSFVSIPCDPALPAAEQVPCPSGMVCVDGDHCEEAGVPASVLGFRIPASNSDSGCWKKIALCESPGSDECLAYVQLHGTTLTPTAPNTINVSVDTEAWSTWLPLVLEDDCDWDTFWCCLSPAPDCDLQIKKRNRAMSTGVDLLTDNPLERLQIDIGDPSIPFTEDDLEITSSGGIGNWLGCGAADLLMPLLFPLFEDQLQDEINDTLTSTTTEMLTETCAAPDQCTQSAPTYCDGDQLCRFSVDDRAVPTLLGVEGKMDLASALQGFAGDATGIAISAAAGGYAEVVAEGIEVGLRGGTFAEPSDCVPEFEQTTALPPRLDFGNSIEPAEGGTPVEFMLGLGVSDRMLDEVVHSMLVSGMMCQQLDAGLSDYINTGALGLISSSLGKITRGGAHPAMIEIKPRSPWMTDIGLGTYIQDPNDPNATIIDEPLLTISAQDVDLDMYAMVDNRFIRYMTMRVALRIGVGFTDDGQGNMLVLVSDIGDWLQDIEIINADLLTDPSEEIENAVPSLISSMLEQFAPSLSQTIELPDMMGFSLDQLIIRGAEQRPNAVDPSGNNVYEFLGIFANLAFDPTAASGSPLHFAAETDAWIHTLEVPAAEAFHVSYPGGAKAPVVMLEATAAGRGPDDRAEFTYRVNGGFWRPFHRGNIIHVTDPAFRFMGRHLVEVRGRLVGEPKTLDPTPARVEVIIDPIAPEARVELDPQGLTATVIATDAMTDQEHLLIRHRYNLGRWTTQHGLAPLTLSELPSEGSRLQIEVIDEAKNTTTLTLGQLPDAPPTYVGKQEGTSVKTGGTGVPSVSSCGCATSQSKPIWWAGLAVVFVITRRRCWR